MQQLRSPKSPFNCYQSKHKDDLHEEEEAAEEQGPGADLVVEIHLYEVDWQRLDPYPFKPIV